MSDLRDRISQLSPKRLALVALELEERLALSEAAQRAPIAVVGMACRVPGADSVDEFWQLMLQGVDAVGEVPADRWDIDRFYDPDADAPGKMASRWGGFMRDVQHFDPAFFGISRREAVSMDPQQRLFLEVAWQAFEHAGQSPAALFGTPTGVFVGVCNSDYSQRLTGQDPSRIDAYLASGNAFSVVSGRLSYVLGLQGPSVSVDTACSSSLVAVHLACQSLRTGESRIAVAGGVNVICSPQTTIALSRSHMMASDGRCKAFDASADGFVRGEGCGVVILKRLSDALTDGDRVLAVIRGSALNQDGRSSGLTAPNGPSQEAVIRAALANAGVEPHAVGYVEAHGTGTSLGDPIEAQALGAAFGKGRPSDRPLVIGSVKTNIGHLESAAGVAGLIKVVLMLQHRRIPAHLHFNEPSPHIPWGNLPLSVAAASEWTPPAGEPRIAGVSSFGFSGTNAHIVLEEPVPSTPAVNVVDRPAHVFTVSAKSPEALRHLASSYVGKLSNGTDAPFGDVCFTAGTGRSHFGHRLALVARTGVEASAQMVEFLEGRESQAIAGRSPVTGTPDVAFLFTGQGAQYSGMGRELYQSQPLFRRSIDHCSEILQPHLGRSLQSILYPDTDDASAINETANTQPALFAVDYALSELWRSWGIEPAIVLGHSLGEYAAACVAGVLSLEDALRLLVERGRLMQSLPRTGAMTAIMASEADVDEAIHTLGAVASLAAINGPSAVVISGPAEEVRRVTAHFEAAGVECRSLAISNGFHSPLVEPILDEFERVASTVTWHAPRIAIVSNVTGELAGADIASAAYWRAHLRAPVRFCRSIETLWAQGVRVFLEAGPHPTLLGMARRCVQGDAAWIPSLRRGQSDWPQILNSMAALYAHGVDPNWRAFDSDYARRKVTLPSYAFQRERCWVETTEPAATVHAAAHGRVVHPLLGSRLRSAVPTFETRLDPRVTNFLGDHVLNGAPMVSAPIYMEMGLAAGREILGAAPAVLETLVIRQPLNLSSRDQAPLVNCVVRREGAADATFEILSANDEDGTSWTLHATGRLSGMDQTQVAEPASFDRIRSGCDSHLAGNDFYDALRAQGVTPGDTLQRTTDIWRRDGEALARLTFTPEQVREASRFVIHPSMLDACTLLVGSAVPPALIEREGNRGYILSAIDRVRGYRAFPADVWVHARMTSPLDAGSRVTIDVTVYDADGAPVADVHGMQLVPMPSALRTCEAGLYDVEWLESTPPVAAVSQALSPDSHRRAVPVELDRVHGDLAVRAQIERSTYGLDAYDSFLPQLDRAVACLVVSALRDLGWEPAPGERVAVDTLASRLGIADRHGRLFGRLLQMLSEDGALDLCDGEVVVRTRFETGGWQESFDRLAQDRPEFAAPVALTARCGRELAAVLRGTSDPLHLLFPNGSLEATEQLYQHSPFAKAFNTVLADALSAVAANVPAGRTLRVLEVGAGTGSTTAYLLPRLEETRSVYTFTDLSPLFLARAQAKFAAFDGVEYKLFDVERDGASQGLAGGYDVVVASNVLHATADLGVTLRNIRRLLAPGGLVLLLEGTGRQRWVDVTFGLTEGWWRFTDADVRPDYPLLSSDRWLSVLRASGFGEAVAIPAEGESRPSMQQAIIAGIAADGMAPQAGTERQLVVVGSSALVRGLGEAAADSARLCATAAELQQTCASLAVAGTAADVICSWDSPSNDIAREAGQSAWQAVEYLQAVVAGNLAAPSRLWFVTRGALNAPGSAGLTNLGDSPVVGIARGISLEHPAIWGGLIDLDPSLPSEAQVDAILRELNRSDDEDQVAARGGRRLIPRLAAHDQPADSSFEIKTDRTYLITGGLGAVGVKVATWLAGCGATDLVLTARRALPPRETWPSLDRTGEDWRRVEAVQGIEALGARVHVASVDVADSTGMGLLFEEFGSTRLPLAGVFHAAVDMSSVAVAGLDEAALQAMLRPKVQGALILDRLTADLDLDAVVLFSSTTALWGVRGLGHYTAANVFLDALAHARRAAGRPFLSVNWGTWDAMRVASTRDQQMFVEAGMHPMQADHALALLGRIINQPQAQLVIAAIDWDVLKPVYEARRRRPFFAQVGGRRLPGSGAAAPAHTSASWINELSAISAEDRRERLIELVSAEVSRMLGAEPGASIDPDKGLFEMGMDSLMSVELKTRLERAVGTALPSTLTFNYPNVTALAGFLGNEILSFPDDTVSEVLDDVDDDESEDELAAQLAARLDGMR